MLLLLRGTRTTSSPRYKVTEVPDSLLGTGLNILVLYNGEIKERTASEGTPIVLVNGVMQTLAAGETLLS